MKKITFFMIKIICLNNNESKFFKRTKIDGCSWPLISKIYQICFFFFYFISHIVAGI